MVAPHEQSERVRERAEAAVVKASEEEKGRGSSEHALTLPQRADLVTMIQIPLEDPLQSFVERRAQNRAKRAGEVAAVFDPERLARQDLGQPLRFGAFADGDERSVHLRVAGEAAAEILSADAVCRRANVSGTAERGDESQLTAVKVGICDGDDDAVVY